MSLKLREYRLNRRRLAIEVERVALDREKQALEQEKLVRARWWHEDGLIAQRVTWLLTSQAILGTGYTYLRSLVKFTYGPDGQTYIAQESLHLSKLASAAPLVAIAVCAFLLLGIHGAARTKSALQRLHPQFALGVSPLLTNISHIAAQSLAVVFIIVWGIAFRALQ